MRLIIHIGYNKTGTSSIQSYCYKNAVALQSDGLCYPKTGTHDNAHYAISKLFLGAPSNEQVDAPIDLLNKIKTEFDASSCNSLLLSSEYLVLANAEKIQTIKDAFQEALDIKEYKIVVYLRRHDLWFESLFNQAVKNIDAPPWELDIKDYIIHSLGGVGNIPHYFTVLQRWAKIFGPESIIVRPFEDAQFKGGNLLNDFFEYTFPQHKVKADASSIRTNLSVSPENLYMIGILRRWPKSPERDVAISGMLNAPKSSIAGFPQDFGILTARQRKSIIRFFKPEYSKIARRFMNRTDGKLFIDEIKS